MVLKFWKVDPDPEVVTDSRSSSTAQVLDTRGATWSWLFDSYPNYGPFLHFIGEWCPYCVHKRERKEKRKKSRPLAYLTWESFFFSVMVCHYYTVGEHTQ
jgi:hypothetical protein